MPAGRTELSTNFLQMVDSIQQDAAEKDGTEELQETAQKELNRAMTAAVKKIDDVGELKGSRERRDEESVLERRVCDPVTLDGREFVLSGDLSMESPSNRIFAGVVTVSVLREKANGKKEKLPVFVLSSGVNQNGKAKGTVASVQGVAITEPGQLLSLASNLSKIVAKVKSR